MIQRIQTIWLLLGMACGVLLLYFPVWQLAAGNPSTGMETIGADTHFYLLGFAPVIFITHAIAIWSFKNRKRQIRLCNINVLLFILFLIAALLIIEIENRGVSNLSAGRFKIGAFLTLLGIIFNFRARRAIKKDEDVIRSMDRLR
jgi:peptidoglycan/LPS O-acetylase OafA/YrhL